MLTKRWKVFLLNNSNSKQKIIPYDKIKKYKRKNSINKLTNKNDFLPNSS